MSLFRSKRVYLDYASTTPTDPRIMKIVSRTQKKFANPSAIHAEGVVAKKLLNEARTKIARLAQVKSEEVFFTASGTESNNIVVQGVIAAYAGEGLPHIVTTTIEHPAILEVCRTLEKSGKAEVTYVCVNEEGLVSTQDIKKSLKKNTVLVSVMQVNNEIGTIQPISQIARLVRKYKKEQGSEYPYLHTDASQGPCYLDFHIGRLGADLITLDGIKTYGPKGVAVLIKKSLVHIEPIIFGGGQEKGLRSGTENVPAIVGLAEALFVADLEREKEVSRLTKLRDYLIEEIKNISPEATLNGSFDNRLANNVNMCLPGVDAEFLVLQLDSRGIAVSYSSSCRTKAENATSYVIEALGQSICAGSSLRVTLGRYTTKQEVQYFLKMLREILLK